MIEANLARDRAFKWYYIYSTETIAVSQLTPMGLSPIAAR